MPEEADQDEAVRELTRNLGRRMKVMRSERDWSLSDLATLSGVSRSMLSEIERERANPTLSVTSRIARAFGFTMQEFISLAEGPPAIQTIRSTDPAQWFPSAPGCQIRTLSPLNLEKLAEFYEVTLEPGRELRSQPHIGGARE
ncbi:MAG TPA: helix-turn-helix transcriptional regulator, partial [Verrucomicrobiales bacterium]|nr:helix-turn-helix transcriptional regulator [Verrucomicrobiales bacterium]